MNRLVYGHGQIQPNAFQLFLLMNEVLLEHSHTANLRIAYGLTLQWRSWVVLTGTAPPVKPKY